MRLLAILLLVGCEGSAPEVDSADLGLPAQAAAEVEGSCAECHPRQFAEWSGSSHNYGEGLNGTFQALEVTANYYATHAFGAPIFRQSLLCTGCHAPSTAVYDNEGVTDFNATLRELGGRDESMGRQLRRPADDEDLLPPLGRAIELEGGEDAARRFSFQGITCDTCHKVGAPYSDRAQLGGCLADETEGECAARQFQLCEAEPFDPACLRRSRGQHPHDAPFIEDHIATAALAVERLGGVRYGPFAEGEVAPSTAHDVSSGSSEEARSFNLARYPDGRPFEGQPADDRPYIQSGHFCGTCHDVRLPPLPEVQLGVVSEVSDAQRNDRLEPVHNEPFLRLDNLYTEWFLSPLNLHPDTQGADPDPAEQFPDNPYRNADGSARRLVCQDCHMSLYPFAPPGVFPGEVTHPERCDEDGNCGLAAAEQGARANLKVKHRPRVTTHNMTGVDVALGNLAPIDQNLVSEVTANLPFQRTPEGEPLAEDPVFELPRALHDRRVRMLKTSASISLAGTPEVLERGDLHTCSSEAIEGPGHEHLAAGTCNLPVKAWVSNVNGGHNVAAGFSQERQIWVELTVQDLGTERVDGMPPVVDCLYGDINDLYTRETKDAEGYVERRPRAHTVESANDLVDRLTGIAGGDRGHLRPRTCRGLSGHLIDKPHDEIHEPEADGRLDDEDLLLHRVGNTVPTFEDGTQLMSWHVADLGFDWQHGVPTRCEPGTPPAVDSARVARRDQFHVPGLDAFACQLGEAELNPVVTASGVATRLDGEVVPMESLGALTASVTSTSEERLELLYPFPEYPTLLPHHDAEGRFRFGERFGLAYLTNSFYQTCGCAEGECQGPEALSLEFPDVRDGRGEPQGRVDLQAQAPWLSTYPTLPHVEGGANRHPLDPGDQGPAPQYRELLQALSGLDPKISAAGTPYRQAFTFTHLNADHMPNNRAMRFYEPQRHYWDIRVGPEVVGPIRVTVKLWYRHFPPEFLRLMARYTEGLYRRACLEGTGETYYPHGPLVVEGLAAERFPNAADVDEVQRVLLDQAQFFVDIDERKTDARGRPAMDGVPAMPDFEEDVMPILQDHCMPCHSDVLRHGGLILDYDAWDAYDYPGVEDPNPEREPRLNLVNVAAGSDAEGRALVVPNDPSKSLLLDILSKTDSALREDGVRSRRMPLGTDPISPKELETIRRWIQQGAG